MAQRSTDQDGPRNEFDALEKESVEAIFTLQPGYAVFLGLHEYDGRLPDLSSAGTERWTVRAHQLLERLQALPPDELTRDRRFDRTLLELLLESPLFDLEQTHELERNPMAYVGQISLTPYLVRNYAPPAARVTAMLHLLARTPGFLADGLHRLRHPVPAPYLQLALTIGEGLPSHLAEAEAFAKAASAELGQQFSSARQSTEGGIRQFLAALQTEFLPRATSDFALGSKLYQRLLWVREGIRTPYLEILEEGWRDLRRNQARLESIAQREKPPRTVEQLLEGIFRRHVRADQLIPKAAELVREVRTFVEGRRLLSIPPGSKCRVEETPTYGRALSTASMNPPGPFDPPNEEGIYYVTPVDPNWTPEHQEEWLRSFNDAMLRNITVHEVFPGHFVQFLHFRGSATSLARKAYISSAFTEGWAHYCEQLAVEEGLGRESPDAEVAQLHDALLRDCRLIASVGLHTQGMTVEEATRLFQREAHFEELPAQREAIRGTFNPEYFSYTLGKLAILELRQKWLEPKFGGALARFHDRLLSFGAPPVGLLGGLIAGSD